MKKLATGLLLSCLSFGIFADGGYSVSETNIGALMENPETKAILEKYLPETLANPQFSMSYGLTLEFVKSFDQSGELSDENLAKIDKALSALPQK